MSIKFTMAAKCDGYYVVQIPRFRMDVADIRRSKMTGSGAPRSTHLHSGSTMVPLQNFRSNQRLNSRSPPSHASATT